MQLIHTHPSKEAQVKIDSHHVIVDLAQFEKAQQMEQAIITFIKRRDAGEIRSTKTYNSFKSILGL